MLAISRSPNPLGLYAFGVSQGIGAFDQKAMDEEDKREALDFEPVKTPDVSAVE